MSARRLVFSGSLRGVGKVRVLWSPDWSEYCARLTGPEGELLAEYFSEDKTDAMGTAEAMLAEHARKVLRV